MTGYQEVLTDPSYAGQLVTFTYPELGNTGVNPDDQEADHPHARGVIARQLAPTPSSWRSRETLEVWMQRHGLVGISGVDTRALVRHLREGGAMNGVISTDGRSPADLLDQVRQAPSMEGLNLADQVTTSTPYQWSSPCAVAFDQRLKQRATEADGEHKKFKEMNSKSDQAKLLLRSMGMLGLHALPAVKSRIARFAMMGFK